MGWADLSPDPALVAALDAAGSREVGGNREAKKRWSERFADACAVMVANAMRRNEYFDRLQVRPDARGDGRESFTPLGHGQGKRIDVVAFTPLAGLQVGVSLKGLGFRDLRSGNYDKNLTGRLYELRDEVSVVHEHLPRATMVGVFFVPILGTEDKTAAAPSSFAKTVAKLRNRTGRLDPHMESHAHRCDLAYVALYVPGDDEDTLPRGACRWFDVNVDPPRRGRPRISDTLDLDDVVEQIAAHALLEDEKRISWASPERSEEGD